MRSQKRAFIFDLCKIRDEKTEFCKEYIEKMLMELKRDYINTHGLEKYMIEEDTVKKEMFETIEKQLKMLLTWDIEQ
jgi:hypothetical protein